MKENREVTDTNVEDIEEALEKLSTGKKIKLYELLRTFKREGIENFVTTRKKYVDVILSDYKRVLKENEEKNKIIDSMIKVMIDSSICDYFIKENCKNYAGENRKICDDCIKEYFENKVKEVK